MHYSVLRKDWKTLVAVVLVCCTFVLIDKNYKSTISNDVEKRSIQQDQSKEIERLEYLVAKSTRTVIKLQSDLEQRVRFEGNSGIMEVRSYGAGMHPYHQPGPANVALLNMHNHANNDYTLGMGEFSAVLNGVPFTTRHNDYKLVQPVKAKGSANFHKTTPIEFPPVPPSVLAKGSVAEQASEMREYFKAWQKQDTSIRDYKPYFKAALCYLEGAWITEDEKGNLNDFDSDRHQTDAANWESLNGKTRFMFNSGRKNNLENLPWLPSAFRNVNSDLSAELANFEYRILCHPLKDDLPLNRFKLVDRLALRMKSDNTAYDLNAWELERTALFQLNSKDSDTWHDAPTNRQFLDDLMEQIPGKDNYDGDLEDSADGSTTLPYDSPVNGDPMNTAYYSRFYSLANADAMGRSKRRRGFNDFNLWAAQTEQLKVSGLSFTEDKTKANPNPKPVHQKWSYAIPLEIVYMTPLHKWDPHNLGQESRDHKPDAGGRNGEFTLAKAYDGINYNHFYRTPQEFYDDSVDAGDAADTSGGVVGVLCAGKTKVCKTRASGAYIQMPQIPGIDRRVRMRYPIAPLHSDKQMAMKEFKAFQKLFNDGYYSGQTKKDPTESKDKPVDLWTNPSTTNRHQHQIHLSKAEVQQLNEGKEVVRFPTELADGHTHTVTIKKEGDTYIMEECDGKTDACFDGHTGICVHEDCK